MPTRVAVDAMGGDHAPAAVIAGGLRAVERANGHLHILLCGPREKLEPAFAEHAPKGHACITLVDAPQVIGMGESPVAAVRAKPYSSIHRGLAMHRNGEVDAFLSAGNTGALTAASLFILGRLPHVVRPSIPTLFPTIQGRCLVLDVGSNMDSRPEHLLQFAQMGTAFARHALDLESPRVGLLSVGEEPAKGNELVRASYKLLADCANINFSGNIEGRDILHHAVDVVVCDGFVGNVILKLAESVMTALPIMISQEVTSQNISEQVEHSFMGIAHGLKKRFDPDTYGGCAPLLGVNGTVQVLHGSSRESAFEVALGMAARAVSANLTEEVQRLVHSVDEGASS